MKERIKAFYDQSLIREHGTDHNGNPMLKITIDQQKFAELIVRECAKIADDGCGSACFGLGINGAMLKEHFGVEP